MQSADILTNALQYAADQIGGVVPPVAVINASGDEDAGFVKISNNACYNLPSTLNGVFSTLLVRATRQTAETLGLVALAAAHADPSGRIIVAQENAHGAGSLEKNLRRAFPDLQTIVKFKCRMLVCDAANANADMLLRWTNDAAIRKVKHNRGEFWSAPGVFSWDRPDAGSRLLLNALPNPMPGRIADLGCGNGLLSTALVKKDGITELVSVDADNRAVECCRLNLADKNTEVPFQVLWRDATADMSDLGTFDYVVMNPPFHDQQNEDRELGQRFCNSAMKMLRSGGELYLVANRHMPYEAILEKAAASVSLLADIDGFKVIKVRAR